MQRWNADDDPHRPWVRRRFRDERDTGARKGSAGDEEILDITDEAMQAREVNGRDFAILSRFRSRR
ncbi:MAG: hypothetical protein ACR2QE_21085 [Acidimicrobiales bacterium]